MKRTDWRTGLLGILAPVSRRPARKLKWRQPSSRRARMELLEDRRVLAVDFGDAPDTGPNTGPGNYHTLATNDGAEHTIVVGLHMGASVDGDGGALQNASADADDVNAALPDDEDGLVSPAADLVLTIGAAPTVSVRVTNTTGSEATLYGWIDYNADGDFDSVSEHASLAVSSGTDNGLVTLIFPTVVTSFTGTTYARFRLSTDVAASEPFGPAADGEVEDYRVTIDAASTGLVLGTMTKKIASDTNGGPTLANSDYFGRAVAAIGDIDGDGVTDLAVGATGDDSEANAGGAVHVLLMNTDGTVKGVQRIITVNVKSGDYFGSSVASMGDLDGDGVADLAVGSERDDANGSNRGLVSIVYLNTDGTRKTFGEIGSGDVGGLANGDYFGRSVASMGDLDGDGVTDLAVGAYGDDTGGANRGAVHVLFMNPDGTVKSSQKIANGIAGGPTLANSDQFGSSLASLGDIDGDGVTDLAVGAVGDDTGGNGRGAVHLLFMNSDGTVKSSQKIADGTGGGPTLANGDQFGRSAASLGDLDGDGVADLAVGSYYDDTGGNARGAVHVLFLNADGTVKRSEKIASGVGGGPSLTNDDRFGVSVTSVGDLDGDGRTDLAVGANFDDTGGVNRGAVYVLFLEGVNTDPTFTSPDAVDVAENSTEVTMVTAADDDLPVQDVTISISGGADEGLFEITTEGVLSFTAAPDFEMPTDADGDNVYEVIVEANDGEGGIVTQTIDVTVTAVNDNDPVFTSPNTADVAENTAAVLTVTATDADVPAQDVVFSIAGGADVAEFEVTADGMLSFVAAPDFEIPTDADGDNVYEVIVEANDGEGGTTSQSIQIAVTPANDNDAVFTSPDTAGVAENTAAVLTVTATDADLPAQDVTFSIAGGTDGAEFEITVDGMLSFVSAPDFEAPSDADGDQVYEVIVEADDGEDGTTSQTINVTVTAVNDNNPVFTSSEAVDVAENTSAVMTVTATDADLPAQDVMFSIAGGADGEQFQITTDGILSFVAAPDFEAPTDADGDNVYEVIVEADDGEDGTTSQTINVTVDAVNDNNPVITSPEAVDVVENIADVMTAIATDADLPAEDVTFSIAGGADMAQFEVTAEGMLSFNVAPDFEAPFDADADNVYEVMVEASDGDGGTTTQTINVTVKAINDNDPAFTSPEAVDVAENTTDVMSVTATDADLPAQDVTFSLIGGADGDQFGITSDGTLSFSAAPDFEDPTDLDGDNVYEVIVEASDSESGTAMQTVHVTVTAVNDNEPIFTSQGTASAAENTTNVITVTASDADLPAGAVTFSIAGGADASEFSITPNGSLTFDAAPDFEAPTDANGDNLYVVIVEATDGDLTNLQAILVTVTPANDNDPVFTSPDVASVAENSTNVTLVAATDADLPAQAVTFSIAGGADGDHFVITLEGMLSFSAAPDFEAPTDADGDSIYEVMVEASDGEAGTATLTISVTVTAVNDNNPVFTSAEMVEVVENAMAVTTVTATDADLPAQELAFSIVGGEDGELFGITTGGMLSFLSAPDFEMPTDADGDNVYVVIVQASDGTLTNIQAIFVNVSNVIETLTGDYNLDGRVNAADFTVWRDTLGDTVAPFSGADGDGSGLVDLVDYDVWRMNFGNTLPAAASGSGRIVVDTTAPSNFPGGVVTQVDRPRGGDLQQPVRNRVRDALGQDRALVAWLASRRGEARHGAAASDVDRPVRESAGETSDQWIAAVDGALASLREFAGLRGDATGSDGA